VDHTEPLVCRQRGGKVKVVAYVSDEISVKGILTALGRRLPEEEKAPTGPRGAPGAGGR
jgi:hypothetical protein